ncbi:MAG: hypothetical protein IJ308_04520 [Clostridia bacterium]|nr:hypothetical protein [Clostridia bacterium]
MYIKDEVNTATVRRVYEECKLVITYLTQNDVITTSTDTGEEYPEGWN